MKQIAVLLIVLSLGGLIKWFSVMSVQAHEGERLARAAKFQAAALAVAESEEERAKERHATFAADADEQIRSLEARAARLEASERRLIESLEAAGDPVPVPPDCPPMSEVCPLCEVEWDTP